MFDLKKIILDFLFPIECLGCQTFGDWLCPECKNKIKKNFQRSVLYHSDLKVCEVLSSVDYNDEILSKVLHAYKYDFVYDLKEVLINIFLESINQEIIKNNLGYFDLVCPVPLSKKRKLWRGFNQSEVFAQAICEKFNWTFKKDLIFRRYHTRPQVGLDAKRRLLNVKEIFDVSRSQEVVNKRVLLVDDVITTGSTIKECALALKKAQASEIFAIVLMKG